MSKTIKIPGRIESVATGKVVTGANFILDDTKGKKQNVINEETDAELLRLDQEKQGNLTFDQTPTEDSTNPVTSGGVYAADQMLSQAIEAILLLIPSAASELNKLVDLATMNSSISTATASFKGTYNLVSDLHLTVSATHAQIAAALDALSLGADNNDYAFVQVPNTDTAPTDIAKTERYKFNGDNWAYEYDLNNSGFTTAQWNAINSGITTLLVAKLLALPTNEALTLALAGKQDNLTFDNVPTAGSNNPVKSSGIYTRNNEIVSLINALDVAKQNVLTFDTTPTNGSTNPVTSNGVYLAIQLVQTAVVALDGRMGTAETKISTAEGNIVNLQAAYAALTQSDIVVVSGALPSSGQQQNIIYRQPDQDHTPPQFYSDYMWNGTAWVLLATYNNAIDDVPTAGSNNLVKSGGVWRVSDFMAEQYLLSKVDITLLNIDASVNVTAGKVIDNKGNLRDFGQTHGVTELIEGVDDDELKLVKIGQLSQIGSSFSSIAMYYKDSSNNYVPFYCTYSAFPKEFTMAIPMGMAVRLCSTVEELATIKVKTVSTSELAVKGSFSKFDLDFFHTNQLNQEQVVKVNTNIKTGTKLAPSSTIDNSYIKVTNGEFSIEGGHQSFYIDVYDVSNYVGKIIAIKGKAGFALPSPAYSFSGSSADVPDSKLDNYVITGKRYQSYLLFIPKNAKYLFLGCEAANNLDSLAAFEFEGFYENKVINGKTALSPYSSLTRKYISNNALKDIGDDNFIVDVYDVSSYKGLDIIIHGTTQIIANTTIYSFSTQSSSIDSISGYDNQGLTDLDNAIVRVPTQANYLFVERVIYSQTAELLHAYQPTYEELDKNNLVLIERIDKLEDDTDTMMNAEHALNFGRLAVIGDSIGWGATTSTQQRMAWDIIANKLGMTRNYATSHGAWCYGDTIDNGIDNIAHVQYDTTRKGLYSLLPTNLVGDERLIIMQAGTNDHGESIPLGVPYSEKYILYAHPSLPETPYDNPLPADDPNKQYERVIRVPSYDTATTCGGFNEAVRRLYTAFEHINIVVVLPIKKHMSYLYYDSGYSEMKNYYGLYQQDYIDAIIECANFWGLPIIYANLMDMNPLNDQIKERYFYDGIHPNDIGHYKIAGFIMQNLRNIYYMPDINGVVTDSSNNPVNGAVVQLSLGNIDINNGWELTTGADGSYNFDGIFFGDAGDLTITCTYNGTTLTKTVRAYESTKVDFKLT